MSSSGVRRTSFTPVRPVRVIARTWPSASRRGAGLNPVSGITNASAKPVAAITQPPTTIGSQKATRPRPTLAAIPISDDAADLCAPQIDRTHVLRADLVGQPGVGGAARERVAEAPDRPPGDDGPCFRHRPDEHDRRSHDDEPDHGGQSAAVDVGDDSGRYLEDEDGELHERSDKNELKRAHSHARDEVDGREDPDERVA